MTYDYDTTHIRWQISEQFNGDVYLYRFIPGDNPPYGGWLEFVGDFSSALRAERWADDTEWEDHPLEHDPPEPIPLIGDRRALPLKKVA